MKKNCDNCYNNVRPTVGRILPMDECLADESIIGGQSTKVYWDNNGKDCPHWQEKMKFIRRH
jgi:hypothetical protein